MKSVFISSTFKDMQAERDMLHERIFPRLRRAIGEYGEDIQELDLRWGVDTVEMSEEESGHLVLRVCIDAIDRCRPYIIVLLGERYGWIPEQQLVESLRDERVTAWYEEQMSITNLEIRYGALSEEETLKKCVFCFRDPKLIREIDAEHRSVYDAESPMHRERLNALKEQIRAKTDAVILDYEAGWDAEEGKVCGLEAFGEAIYELLAQMVKRDFAGQEIKNPKERLFLQMERMKEQYLSSYVVRYREELMALDQIWLYDHMKESIPDISETYLKRVIVKGEAGSGKSALMASVENVLRKLGWETILYFSGNSGCQSPDVLKGYVIYRLEEICGLPHEETDNGDERLRFLGEQAEGKKIYCFIDALDQLFEKEKDKRLDILDFCPNLYYVLSALSDYPVEESVKTYVWPFFTCQIEKFTMVERRNMVRVTALKRGKKLDHMITEMTVRESGAGNPLYLSMLLQRYFMMDQKEFEAAETLSPGMEGLHRYMEKLLLEMPDQVEPMAEYLLRTTGLRFGLGWFQEILNLLVLSRYGLSEQELEGILAVGGMRFLQVEFQQLVSYLYDVFVCREDGKWTFAHRLFQKAVLCSMSEEDRRAVWKLLIDYSLCHPEFLEREGFYYILEQRHPAGLLMIEQSDKWKTKFEVRDFIGNLVVNDRANRAYFMDLNEKVQTGTLDEFWLSFNTDNYPPEFGEFLFSIWSGMMRRDTLSAAVKYRCAVSLAIYFHRQGDQAEEGFRLLQRAEKCCEDMPEPEKSRKLSDIYVMRAIWRLNSSMGEAWEEAEEEFTGALKMLEPFLEWENMEERREVLRQDFQNKADYASFCGEYRGIFQEGMLEECLRKIDCLEEEVVDESFERWRVDFCTMLTRAYQADKNYDAEKSLSYGQRAMELSGELLRKNGCLQNVKLRLSAIENYVYCFKKGFRYPYLEEYLLLTRDTYSRYPSAYWKRELAYAECYFAHAVEEAVQNRSKVFPENLRNKAQKCWEEGFRLFEELLKTDYARKVFHNYEVFLSEKASLDEKRGYNRQALRLAGRAREVIDEAVRTTGDFYRKERELRDLDLVMAKALCDLCRPEEALYYARESVDMALKRQEKTGKVFAQTADAHLVYARTLYCLRRDEEALTACEKTEKAYADLADGLESEEARKACAELNYIRSRINLEQGRQAPAEEYLEAFEAFCGKDKNSWEYGQSLILRADYLAVKGEGEQAKAVFEQAYAFWVSRSKSEKTWLTERADYSVWKKNGYIYRSNSRSETGYYRRAVYYRLYCLYKKTALEGSWDGRLVTVLSYIDEEPEDTFYAEWIWLPANIPAFARLTAMVPEEVRKKWMPQKLLERPEADPEKQAACIASGEATKSLPGERILRETIGLYRQVKDSYLDYRTLLSRSERLSRQFQLDREKAGERAGISEKQQNLFANERTAAVRAWYPLLELCGIVYRCRDSLMEKELENLYRLSRNCFLYAGGYEEQDPKSEERVAWNVSPLSGELLELLSAAFGEEKKLFSTAQAARKAQNICALERYRRTGEKRYIACRLRELSELNEFVRGRGEKERAKLAGDIAEFLEEALAQDGPKLADILFEFLEAHEVLKEKMYAGVLEKLREAFMTAVAQLPDENISLQEQAEDFWLSGYRMKWERRLEELRK